MKISPKCRTKKLEVIYTILEVFADFLIGKGPILDPKSGVGKSLATITSTFSKFRYYSFRKVNNKGTALMRRLVCTFVVRKPPKTGLLASRPICGVR